MAVIRTVTVDGPDTRDINVVVASEGEVDEIIERIATKAMNDGRMVTYPDGRRMFRHRVPVEQREKAGSDHYIWHEDGNRIRCQWIEITLHPDGRREINPYRKVWVDYLQAVDEG